jgi:hypothetical protein
MMLRAVLPAIILLSFTAAGLGAQANLSVDLQDPVYQLLELGELKGALSRLSAVRPYSRSRVVALLQALWESRFKFTAAEQKVLEGTLQRFGEEPSGLRHGNLTFRQGGEGARKLQVGADARSRFRLNANSPENWHMDSVLRLYLRGDLVSWLSYLGIIGVTLDRARSDEAFAPYGFSKQWDVIHYSLRGPVGGEELDYPAISYDLQTEITAQLLRDSVRLSLARLRREWGIGDGSLTLGGSARPFVGVEMHVQLAPWLIMHQLVGSLSNWEKEPASIGAEFGELTYQKLFALQRLEILPFRWLYLSVSSTVVGAKRFELSYAAPLLAGALAQELIADLDNVGVGFDLAVTIPPWGRAFFSLYADEMAITNPSDLFTRPRNMFALQGGLKVPIPGLPLTALTVQYTKIEPFTYAHYPTWYPDYRMEVDTAYTHDGENLAYPLWPNSDELLVKLTSVPIPSLRAGLEYRMIRHGDNPSWKSGDPPAILGRPDGWFDYDLLEAYPDKAFLHDGLYDHNHIVTLSGEYSIQRSPVTVGLSYTFAFTYWKPNDSGEQGRPNRMRNIVGLEVKVFR